MGKNGILQEATLDPVESKLIQLLSIRGPYELPQNIAYPKNEDDCQQMLSPMFTHEKLLCLAEAILNDRI